MSWKAIIPLKQSGDRKSRLSAVLSLTERIALSDEMATHVVGTALAAGLNAAILSPTPFANAPWLCDHGRGLNAQLDQLFREAAEPMLVVHADLPFLCREDLLELTAAADGYGAAIAPDHLGTGTNAIALRRAPCFSFAFGPDSLAAHRASLPSAVIIRRQGLELDVDCPADLPRLQAHI